MHREIWSNYIKGFKFLLPFILVKVLFESINANLGFSQYDFFVGNFSTFKQTVTSNWVQTLFSLFVGSLFYSFLMVVVKSLVNEKDISFREIFKESLGIYTRYLALTIIISTIFLGVMFLGFWDIIMPLAVIFVIYLSVLFTPCNAYLVYNDASPTEALKKGISLGKKYSGEIILLSIALSIIVGTISVVGINLADSTIGYVLISFIITSIYMYSYIFAMTICKKGEETEKAILKY
ncbi:hypothetical protein KQI86_02795 [Clostridium sp. MSJ-11]|uniref:Uncharacterized protein n=1 Tax=Clostridium mobile TaxID=2841512 RepID=A0ABS6EDG6_9CLOT|nr:hypothetical protein [Clostridium mobile]MBU5483239.1 hypothetical protein [Clostridium mobile]